MRPLPLLPLAILLAGCGVAPPAGGAKAPAVMTPDLDTRSSLRLPKLGRTLAIGEGINAATDLFPPLRGAYTFNDLPSGFGEGFEARGWETRLEGFGIIAYSGRIALAMRQLFEVEKERADDLQRSLERLNQSARREIVPGPNLEYRFWLDGNNILMLLRRTNKPGFFAVTIALGERQVMAALKMTPEAARATIDRLTNPKNSPPVK